MDWKLSFLSDFGLQLLLDLPYCFLGDFDFPGNCHDVVIIYYLNTRKCATVA